jgi:hypothetical protein
VGDTSLANVLRANSKMSSFDLDIDSIFRGIEVDDTIKEINKLNL